MLTTGTDTMEEVAVLCGLTYGGDAPIVITGANRPGSAPGADGPANLLDAIILARAPAAAGLGVVVAFGGEVHAAMTVRKIDSTGPVAFGSPTAGPLGRIVEGRVWLHATPRRPSPLAVRRLDHRVSTVTTGLGDDGAMLRHAAEISDGVVLVALGAGHLSQGVLRELRQAAASACPSSSPAARTARRCCSRPTASRAPSATCARAARSAPRSCRRRRRGWRCCAASARTSTAPASRPRSRRSTRASAVNAVRSGPRVAVSSHASSAVTVGSPAMAERTKYSPGTFSWADLSTTDQDGAKQFYGGLFGWDADDQPVGDGMTTR